jgi:hypothetical protein
LENLKERSLLEDLWVDGSVIIEFILKHAVDGVLIGFMWLWVEISGGLF